MVSDVTFENGDCNLLALHAPISKQISIHRIKCDSLFLDLRVTLQSRCLQAAGPLVLPICAMTIHGSCCTIAMETYRDLPKP
jgi:hypothetical protein